MKLEQSTSAYGQTPHAVKVQNPADGAIVFRDPTGFQSWHIA